MGHPIHFLLWSNFATNYTFYVVEDETSETTWGSTIDNYGDNSEIKERVLINHQILFI